jgi:hypothetical protein
LDEVGEEEKELLLHVRGSRRERADHVSDDAGVDEPASEQRQRVRGEERRGGGEGAEAAGEAHSRHAVQLRQRTRDGGGI